MHKIEIILRMTALPISVFSVVFVLGVIWAEHPGNDMFFFGKVLPIYSTFLILTSICWKVTSLQISQFLMASLFISSLFVGEMALRLFLDISLF